MKAFIFDPLWPKLADEKLEKQLAESGVDTTIVTDVKPLTETPELFAGNEERLLCLNPDYVGWKLKNEDYEGIPNLKGIFTESTGYEWVEPEAANRLDVPICNIKAFNTQAVAEWAILIMFNLARQTPRLIKDDFPLDFDKDFLKYRGVQLRSKTAGIIGLGNIGSAIAERCVGLGMNVVYWSRSSTNDAYQKLSLEEVLSTADVIFPATAKNDETVSLINDDMIRTMKKDAMVVDIVHAVFNHQLLLDMVADGDLYGYGFEGEPKDFATFEGNVWAAPAYAWATYESMYNSVAKLIENIISAAKGEFPNRVNS